MTELGSIVIDQETALALREWLDSLVKQRRSRIAKVERDAAEEARHDCWHTKTRELAAQTAHVNGITEGLAVGYMASATWDAFIACEGWFSPFDIDEHFDTGAKYVSDYQETWELAYIEAIDAMRKA